MYCIKCGVKLEDTENKCPLCGTVVYHPDIVRTEVSPLYPKNNYPKPQVRPIAALIIVTTIFLLPIVLTALVDIQVNKEIKWSGYVSGALVVGYIMMVLPYWFRKPKPVIFVPCSFTATGLYLWYINFATGGDWFLSFAFPLVGGVALIVTAVVALVKYVKKGMLYIFGGALIALGTMMFPLEILINYTFNRPGFVFWSIYPWVAFGILGGLLIFLAIYKPARESMERKFFV